MAGNERYLAMYRKWKGVATADQAAEYIHAELHPVLPEAGKEHVMRFAILSDIHGNIPALEAVWAEIRKNDVEHVYNLGDSLNGPLWPEETAEFIISNNIESILGNGDEDILNKKADAKISSKTIDWLNSLEKIWMNKQLTLFHATPYSTKEYLFEKIMDNQVVIRGNEEIKEIIKGIKTKYVACGHSHVERIAGIDGQIVINAGSVGLPAYSDDDPYHCMETLNAFAKFITVDDDAVKINLVEYDHAKAAERAKQNNRMDWYNWITTGRVN